MLWYTMPDPESGYSGNTSNIGIQQIAVMIQLDNRSHVKFPTNNSIQLYSTVRQRGRQVTSSSEQQSDGIMALHTIARLCISLLHWFGTGSSRLITTTAVCRYVREYAGKIAVKV